MMTKQEFLERELIHQIQRSIWQLELEGMSFGVFIESLRAIISQYDAELDVITLNDEIKTSLISQKK